MSLELIKGRLRLARRVPIFDVEALKPVNHGRDIIQQILPHRGNMLLLDAIVGIGDGKLRARRVIALDDPVFEGHFPGDPVYPGALQVEAIGQAGLCLRPFLNGGTLEDIRPEPVRLVRLQEAQFTGEVRPGDEVEILSELVEDNGYTFATFGQMLLNGNPVSSGVFEAMILEDV